MIDKFVNDELSEEDTDDYLSNFFDQDDEKRFKKKWFKIIDEELEKYNSKQSKYFNKHIFAISSTAAILFIIVAANIFIIKNDYQYKLKYSIFNKGDSKNIHKLDSLADMTFKKYTDALIRFDDYDYNLFFNKNYKKIYRKNDKLLEDNNNLNDETNFISALSSIKKNRYKKAKIYLKKINPKSPYYNDKMKMMELIDKILKK